MPSGTAVGRITEVVDQVREKRDAARQKEDERLRGRGNAKHRQR